MIEKFFISKVRVKILKLFLLHINSTYHVREIVRQLNEEINAVRRILKSLEEIKFLVSEKNGNRVYYSLNKNFIFFIELFSLINKEYGIGGRIIKHKGKIGNVRIALLSNSYINNKRKNPQEIDLLIIGSNINYVYLEKIVKDAEDEIGREINYTYLSPTEFDNSKKKNELFISNVIFKSKVILIGDEEDLYK